eukprot:937278-Rhodomonas_salina.1
MLLRAPYAAPDTDVAASPAMRLRALYTKPGTDIACNSTGYRLRCVRYSRRGSCCVYGTD